MLVPNDGTAPLNQAGSAAADRRRKSTSRAQSAQSAAGSGGTSKAAVGTPTGWRRRGLATRGSRGRDREADGTAGSA